MNRLKKLLVAAGALAAGVTLLAGPAGATPPSGYGFDDTPHVIVGGGSDTTYKAMLNLTNLYLAAPGCEVVTDKTSANLGKCITVAGAETNTLGNYQHDTVAQASPTGSSAGITSLNQGSGGTTVYNGTVNVKGAGPNVDFARSSRGPSGSELATDTFWGFAQDGVEVAVFDGRRTTAQASTTGLTGTELYHIYNCDYTQWSQIPSLGIAAGSADDGPIVPWGMNPSSGTYGTFNSWIISNSGGLAASTWDIDSQTCVRKQPNGQFPFENDAKQLFDAAVASGGLSTSASSTNNPNNWVWWSSFGELSTFPYKANWSSTGTTADHFSYPAPVNGILPSGSRVLANTYPIGRTLYHVTLNTDADCPLNGTSCDFTNNPGPAITSTVNDLNVTGPTSGTGGAVREFTRWLCRNSAQQHTKDSYTGTNLFNAINSAINTAGYQLVPTSLRTAGSRCRVLT